MTATQQGDDVRWDNRVPWYLRHEGAALSGNVDEWLDLIGQRVERLFAFNEVGVLNEVHFGSFLESETLGRFRFNWGAALSVQLRAFFRAADVRRQAESDALADPVEQKAQELGRQSRRRGGPSSPAMTPELNTEVFRASLAARETRAARTEKHWANRVYERVSTLEAIMRTVGGYGTNPQAVGNLVADVRRFAAATRIPLDVRGSPPLIYPLEEPLLQREVIEPLLARLAERWPNRAAELVSAYHDVVAGKPLDEVFSSAFKSLEEIARALTSDTGFEFNEGDLKHNFPSLHPTIRAGMVKLRAHRGDSAAHGRKAPSPSETRFLLFQICNIALLLLDTQPADS